MYCIGLALGASSPPMPAPAPTRAAWAFLRSRFEATRRCAAPGVLVAKI